MIQTRMPRRILRGLVAGAVLAVLACLPTRDKDVAGSGTELGNVIGMIYTADNHPAGGIEVTLHPLDGDTNRILRTTTRADGAFDFHALPGSYRLVSLDGHGNGLSVDSIDALAVGQVDLSHRNLAPLGGLSAYVRVANTATQYKVELSLLASPFSKRVDPNTGFDWEGLSAGRYWLRVYYPGAHTQDFPVVIEPGRTTVLSDTIDMDFQFSGGISRRDTLVLSSSQLPYIISDKIFAEDADVDTIYWVLNGQKMPLITNHPRMPSFSLTREMLRDTGLNLIELRIFLKDTAVARHWYIKLDDSTVKPWAYQAVRAVFLDKQPNPRPDGILIDLGRFRILNRRTLSDGELVYWERKRLVDANTAVPEEITIPIVSRAFDGYQNCGTFQNKYPTIPYFPGDTVTFFLFPDSIYGGQAFRIKADERFQDLSHMAYFARAHWPLAGFLDGKGYEKFSKLNPFPRPNGLHFRQVGDLILNDTIETCLPTSRTYVMDSAGTVRETLAAPPGFSSATLLLHFRADFRDGIVSDSLPRRSTYVFIDSSGMGLAGSGGSTRSFQLTASELSELRAGLAAFPAPVPLDWETDYMDNVPVRTSADSTQYLFTDARATIFYQYSTSAPAAKRSLFTWVEGWLKSKDLI